MDVLERQRMMPFLARFQRGSLPPRRLVESRHKLSARLAIWTRLSNATQQPAQLPSSRLVQQPSSRLAELASLLRCR